MLEPALDELGIEHQWELTGAAAARVCEERRFEVALVDVGVRNPQAVLQALDLRGRRLRRAVILFSDSETPTPSGVDRLGMEVVPVEEAAAGSSSLPPRRDEKGRLKGNGGSERDRADPGDRAPRRELARRERRQPTRSASSSATPPTCARPSSRSARARRSCSARTWRPCARCRTRSRRATPTRGKHAERVTAYGIEIARALGLPVSDAPELEFGFLLHDIGKVAIPDAILYKPGALTRRGARADRRSTRSIGAEIVREIEFLGDAGEVVRSPPRAVGRHRLSGRPRAARRSRWRHACSRSPTCSTRSPPTGRTGRPRR